MFHIVFVAFLAIGWLRMTSFGLKCEINVTETSTMNLSIDDTGPPQTFCTRNINEILCVGRQQGKLWGIPFFFFFPHHHLSSLVLLLFRGVCSLRVWQSQCLWLLLVMCGRHFFGWWWLGGVGWKWHSVSEQPVQPSVHLPSLTSSVLLTVVLTDVGRKLLPGAVSGCY